MKLSGLHLNDLGYYRSGFIITEGYGRVLNYNYDNFKVDPRPKVLLLGRWRHPRTRNNLVAGINLNYLSDEQKLRLRQALPEILKSRNLRRRYWKGREVLPDIFNDLYRTYDARYVHAVTPATLRFWKPEAEKKKAALAAKKAEKQRELGIEVPEPEVPEVPKIARARVEPEPEEERPEEPEELEEPETAQQRRNREREEAEKKRAERGTRKAREARREEEPEEPE